MEMTIDKAKEIILFQAERIWDLEQKLATVKDESQLWYEAFMKDKAGYKAAEGEKANVYKDYK